jgi:hypothetical protein
MRNEMDYSLGVEATSCAMSANPNLHDTSLRIFTLAVSQSSNRAFLSAIR